MPQLNVPACVTDGGTRDDPRQNYIKTHKAVQNKHTVFSYVKSKGVSRQAEVALGVPGRLTLNLLAPEFGI